jgi:hypothetical protein
VSTPEQPTTPAGGTRPGGYGGMTPSMMAGARLPIPGNAEFVVFFLIWVFLIIVWASTDAVDAGLFATLTTILTFGYLLSRGIAKASRVLEQ